MGTYATVELHEAVKKYGYKVLQIFDIWHFNTFAQYDPDTQQEGLFDTYIDRHFKERSLKPADTREMYGSRRLNPGDL